MSPNRWNHIKSLPKNSERYYHVSAYAKMVRHDISEPLVPWIERPGVMLVLRREARRNETSTPRELA